MRDGGGMYRENDAGLREHGKGLGFYFKANLNSILESDDYGSFPLVEYKFPYTAEKKPGFRVRQIWV